MFMVFTVIIVSAIIFAMSRVQGDPRFMYLDNNTTKEQWDAWGRQMGLDRPIVVQYFVWLGKAVRLDFGQSMWEKRPVTDLVMNRFPNTLQLGAAAWIFAVVVGLPLGVLSAVMRGTAWDYLGRTIALFGQALPPFWLGIMLILLFAVQLEWLPIGRKGGPDHLILPAITLGWLAAAGLLRLVRSAMLEVLDSEFVKLARAKGVTPWLVIWKHTLRNALLVPLTYSVLILSGFLAGTVVTETVFQWPGVGRLAVQAINTNDFPTMVGAVLFATVLFVVANLLLDISYTFIDPRIRYR